MLERKPQVPLAFNNLISQLDRYSEVCRNRQNDYIVPSNVRGADNELAKKFENYAKFMEWSSGVLKTSKESYKATGDPKELFKGINRILGSIENFPPDFKLPGTNQVPSGNRLITDQLKNTLNTISRSFEKEKKQKDTQDMALLGSFNSLLSKLQNYSETRVQENKGKEQDPYALRVVAISNILEQARKDFVKKPSAAILRSGICDSVNTLKLSGIKSTDKEAEKNIIKPLMEMLKVADPGFYHRKVSEHKVVVDKNLKAFKSLISDLENHADNNKKLGSFIRDEILPTLKQAKKNFQMTDDNGKGRGDYRILSRAIFASANALNAKVGPAGFSSLMSSEKGATIRTLLTQTQEKINPRLTAHLRDVHAGKVNTIKEIKERLATPLPGWIPKTRAPGNTPPPAPAPGGRCGSD